MPSSSNKGAQAGKGGGSRGESSRLSRDVVDLQASTTEAAENLIAEGIPARILELHALHQSLRTAGNASEATAARINTEGSSPPSLPSPGNPPSPPARTGVGPGGGEEKEAVEKAEGVGKEGGEGEEAGKIDHVNAEVFALFRRVKALVLRLVEDLGVLSRLPPSRPPVLPPSPPQCKRYPLVADFKQAVAQMDRQQILSLSESVMVGWAGEWEARGGGMALGDSFFGFRRGMAGAWAETGRGIRNSYLLIHDKLMKNQDRLKQASKPPRHSSHMVC
ncbi:hypothetical protein NSK_005744 [Nannochloropsis salina CCMP1776]|uniref:Uncharacterized protein n=1 Tax=Nannochloropsis salina CCMP1776 TaxID=1027361 RepID=A0A4D9CUK3_9STRA|nr:hypothetical protein NSK_005744 [Nannochloropsis salina CCMP1776]|eukprot:TFJ82971.1 hypothetical protein NSK_005744 [Nannochloropsis salina CCMP1776]